MANWEIRAFELSDDTELGVIADWQSFQFEDTLSDTGSGEVLIDPDFINRAWTKGNKVWRFYQDGVRRFGMIPEKLELVLLDEEENDPIYKISGRGLGQVLEWAVVYPGNFPAKPDVIRDWTARSLPDVLHLFMVEAHNRGTLSMLDIGSWSNGTVPGGSQRDTANVLWGKLISSEQRAGINLLELTSRWAELHPFDWHVDVDFNLDMWNSKGTDKSASIILHPGGSVDQEVTTEISTFIRNVIVVEATDLGVTNYTDATSIAKWGRREKYIAPDEAVDDGTSAQLADPVLQANKNEATERVVKMSPSTGRMPWLDFNLGDTIGVEFPEGILKFRTLAFAVSVDEDGNEDVEAVIDSLLKPSVVESAVETSGGGSSGPNLVYQDNSDGVLTVTTSPNSTLAMTVETTAIANLRAGLNLQGVASVQQTITVDVLYGASIAKTFKQVLFSGDNDFAVPFILLGVPEGIETWRLRISVSTGTFTIAKGLASWWMESKSIAGGLQDGQDPNQVANDTVNYTTVTDSNVGVALQTPMGASVANTINYTIPTETAGTGAGIVSDSQAGANDGWVSDVPSFQNTTTTLQAGYLAGEMREAFMLFPLPIPAGVTIVKAAVRVYVDANAAVAPVLTVRVEDNHAPSAPVSRADLQGRTYIATTSTWSQTATAGQIIDIDVSAQITALLAGGSTAGVLVRFDNSGPATDAMLVFRAFEHGTGPKPLLIVQYH